MSDGQWELMREHFPEENIPDGRAGRNPVTTRKVLEVVLWMLNTGAQWHMLQQNSPSYKTVHRRSQQWCRSEVLRNFFTRLANTLRKQGEIDERESFIDATIASAKGGGAGIGKTKLGKGVKIMGIVDRNGLPLAVCTHAANHHEVTLVQLSFDFYVIEAKPEKLIGDKAYDSDDLDDYLGKHGIDMISPHNSNRVKDPTQDGRKLRRDKRRWIVDASGLGFSGIVVSLFDGNTIPSISSVLYNWLLYAYYSNDFEIGSGKSAQSMQIMDSTYMHCFDRLVSLKHGARSS